MHKSVNYDKMFFVQNLRVTEGIRTRFWHADRHVCVVKALGGTEVAPAGFASHPKPICCAKTLRPDANVLYEQICVRRTKAGWHRARTTITKMP